MRLHLFRQKPKHSLKSNCRELKPSLVHSMRNGLPCVAEERLWADVSRSVVSGFDFCDYLPFAPYLDQQLSYGGKRRLPLVRVLLIANVLRCSKHLPLRKQNEEKGSTASR